MNLVLGGGGINGIAYIGLIKILEEKNILNKINKFAGTSVGALFIFIISLRCDYTFIYDLFIHKLKYIFNPNYYNIFDGNIYDKTLLENIIRGYTYYKLNKKYITFLEYYNLSKHELNIVGVNLYTSKKKIFNVKNTPNVDVVDAILASMSIPMLSHSVEINNKYYVDGSFYNVPTDIFENKKDKTIVVVLRSNKKKANNIYTAYINLIETLIQKNSKLSKKRKKNYIYYIEVECILNCVDLNVSIKDKKKAYNLYTEIIRKQINNIDNNK